MNVTTLMNLLGEAVDINDRSVFYRDQIPNQVHPLFLQIIGDYTNSTLVLENNPALEQIRILIDELLLRITEQDLEPISAILNQLANAAKNLQPAAGDPDLADALLETDTLYSQATVIYNEALTLLESHGQIAHERSLFQVGATGSLMFKFALQFDAQLDRDRIVIEILRDTFLTFTEKLQALREKIVQLMVTPPNLPLKEASDVVTLIDQCADLTTIATNVVEILQDVRSQLTSLGQGLVKGEVDINDDLVLSEMTSALNYLISNAHAEGQTADAILVQLNELASGFTADTEDPQLTDALESSAMRLQEAKPLHEDARLLKIAFVELDTIQQQLDSMESTPEEKTFYSGFRTAIDKFHLLSVFIDSICDKYEISIGQIWDILDMLLNDPRNKVQTFDDKLPFALLPVRVETRFMTIKHVRDNIIYSSTYDVLRSDDDATNMRAVKQTNTLMETSGPKEGEQLQEAPAIELVPDKHELWVRIYPDNIAIHNHEDPLSQSEIDDAQIYWEENWKALGDTKLELGAWRVLCSSYGSQRAAWIISQTTPTNTKPTTSTPTPHPSPTLPPLTPRPASWSQQPHTRVMPERFVVRVYPKNNPWREIVGQKVPSPLPVGFDPTDPYANYLDQYGAEINMPQDLRWLTHFEEAEKVGMGIRIPLQSDEKDFGFKRLLVLGLKLDLNASDAADELEVLLDNHHYSSGLAIVPQGTPTNNTDESKSGFASIEPGYEESFEIELGSNQFTSTSVHYDKTDGQRLAEALGVNHSVFQHIGNAKGLDIQESMDMTRALWPATLGYYLKNMLTPSVVSANISDTKTFFSNYVFGRGLFPAFRVKNQPYGLLTSTVYSKWKYNTQFIYEEKLFNNVLNKLRKYWKTNFVPKVLRVGAPPVPSTLSSQDVLVNILGLHPSSVEFHQRITVGSILASNIVNFLNSANPSQTTPQIVYPSVAAQLNAIYKSATMESFSYFNSPRIFSMAFAKSQRLLNGPVIDTLPLSEKRQIEVLGNGYSNYIEWLASSPISYIKAENFSNPLFSPNQSITPPKALLYLLLRHAWLLEYLDTAHCLLTSVDAISQDAWHNHELMRMAAENTPQMATEEQKSMLHGFVKAEVEYENELVIEDVMLNLSTNQDYQSSGLTPEQYHLYLRDLSRPTVETTTANRYEERLNEYYVDQGQWSYLDGTFAELSSEFSVADHIKANINSGQPCYAGLKETHSALTKLQTLPTARLERCLAEHLDTCTYRLDSWLNGLVSKRLLEQRAATPSGIYLGAYGILEDVKPNEDFPGIHVVNLSPDSWKAAQARLGQRKTLDLTPYDDYPADTNGTYVTEPAPETQPATFLYLGEDEDTKLIEDPESGRIVAGQRTNPDNQGFILAPSLNHAVAAAVMKAGYQAHKGTTVGQTMAVTLSSDRVRIAMYYLDGIRHGQNLAALLGYQFERGIHERQNALNAYILELREKFPLVAGTVIPTSGGSYNNDAQSRHVVNGLQLLHDYAKTSPTWYTIPGLSTTSGSTVTLTNDGKNIEKEIKIIKGHLDAIGDLLLSEAIFQVTRGNHERAGSVLQALGYGGLIPEPEIVKTPRQADTFMHRCVVQLTPATTSNSAWTGTSIRANAEPALNNWLASQLPDPANIQIVYDYDGSGGPALLSMIDLEIQPIDLLAIFTASESNNTTDGAELSKRAILKARDLDSEPDTTEITIDYRSRLVSTQRTVFELTPILQSLSRIVSNSRMLNPDDFVTPGALTAMPSPAGALDSLALETRIINALNDLDAAITSLTTNIPLAEASNYTATELNDLRDSLMAAAQFGSANAIPDTLTDTSDEIRDSLVAQGKSVLAELEKRYALADTKLNTQAAIPAPDPPNYNDLDQNNHKAKVIMLSEIAKMIFGKPFKVFTNFTLHNLAEVTTASTYAAAHQNFLANAGPFPVESWMAGVARVRPRMGDYHKQMLIAESVRFNPSPTATFNYTKQTVFQFPVVNSNPATPQDSDCWIGMKLPANYTIPLDAISMVVESNTTTSTIPTCGMVIDEWPEQIPVDRVTSGIAINYDQPSSEAPQTILMAVTPEMKNYWLWDDLMDTLNETIEMAQIRACEPDMIQNSLLSQVVPTLVAQMNSDGSNASPSLDFARNIVSVPNGFDDPINISTY